MESIQNQTHSLNPNFPDYSYPIPGVEEDLAPSTQRRARHFGSSVLAHQPQGEHEGDTTPTIKSVPEKLSDDELEKMRKRLINHTATKRDHDIRIGNILEFNRIVDLANEANMSIPEAAALLNFINPNFE